MLIHKLDRVLWTLREATDYVAAQIIADLQSDPTRLAEATKPPVSWQPRRDPTEIARARAREEIQIALRDGDLHAIGRYSNERAPGWSTENDGWQFHSGRHSPISPEQWRAGRPSSQASSLVLIDGHFIDIRVPRFMVMAIWPRHEQPTPQPSTDGAASAEPYRTPYLDLLERAIVEHGLSATNQGKKELLSEWLQQQTVEGMPVSQNLADAMATLIRLPASQRGGAKRGW